MQEKWGVSGEVGLWELGGVGSRAWQLPPFLQSWVSRQGSGNWQVSPRNPGAHLGVEGHFRPVAPPPSPPPLSPQVPLLRSTLTGRSLVPEIASGRCLRWHRALGILHTEALEKRLEGEMEPQGLWLALPPPGTPHRAMTTAPTPSPSVAQVCGAESTQPQSPQGALVPGLPFKACYSSYPLPVYSQVQPSSIPRKQDNSG